MNRKPAMTAVLLAAVFGTPGAVMPTPVQAEEFRATIVVGHPPVIRWTRMFPEAFIPAVQKRLAGTANSFTFDEQYGGTIAAAGEELETMQSGLAEMGVCNAVVDPAKLSMQNVTYYAPFVSADARLINETLDEMNKSDPELTATFDTHDVVYLGGPIGLDDYLLMTKTPINGFADLSGLKISAPGAAVNWLSGSGAVGVAGNLTTYYNELKTGVYDGVIMFATGIVPSKLYEVAPYVTRFGLGAQYAGGICANKAWFNGLPADVQTVLRDSANDTRDWYLNDLEAATVTAFAKMQELGAIVTDASDETRQQWADSMDNAAKVWATELDAQGKPATRILGEYMDAMRAAGAKPLRDWDKE